MAKRTTHWMRIIPHGKFASPVYALISPAAFGSWEKDGCPAELSQQPFRVVDWRDEN